MAKHYTVRMLTAVKFTRTYSHWSVNLIASIKLYAGNKSINTRHRNSHIFIPFGPETKWTWQWRAEGAAHNWWRVLAFMMHWIRLYFAILLIYPILIYNMDSIQYGSGAPLAIENWNTTEERHSDRSEQKKKKFMRYWCYNHFISGHSDHFSFCSMLSCLQAMARTYYRC